MGKNSFSRLMKNDMRIAIIYLFNFLFKKHHCLECKIDLNEEEKKNCVICLKMRWEKLNKEHFIGISSCYVK